MGNRSSTLSHSIGGGEDTAATNKRKRDDDDDSDELLHQSSRLRCLYIQPPGIVTPENNISPTFSTMPESLLLHVFSFILTP